MSQYPGPYSPPPPQTFGYGSGQPYDPVAQLTGPCRRASVLMFVLGGLLLLLGGCVAGVFWLPGLEEQMAKQGTPMPPGETFESVRSGITKAGVVMIAVALAEIVLGGFVRRGSRPATVAAIVISFLVLAWLAYEFLGGLAEGASRGMVPQAAMGACILLVPLALTVWQLTWLFQSNSAAGQLTAWQAQYASQYYQYQQQQAGYPSQQPQVWQQQPPPGQWPPPQQGGWPPPQQQPPPPPPQNWPPPPQSPA